MEVLSTPFSFGTMRRMESGFSDFLKQQLQQRQEQNPRYSLRAFAKFLNCEPSFLSKILLGKRSVTSTTILKFSDPLKLSKPEIDNFLDWERKNAQRPHFGAKPVFRDLSAEEFKVLSEWYHFAILELVTLKDFKADPGWIAERLNITKERTSGAVERLFELGFLKEVKKGVWVNHSGNNSTLTQQDSTAALAQLQKQVLEKAIHALQEISVTERDQSTITLAIPRSLVPSAKERIKKFRRELMVYLQKSKTERDSVYHLSISFYPVTKKGTSE